MASYTIYTASNIPNCPYCDKAKKLLAEHHIVPKEIQIGRDITKAEFHERYGEYLKTVPVIFVDEALIGGYSALIDHFSKTPSSSF